MGKYTNLATDILNNIGGKENVKSLTHCVTRLRFSLEEPSSVQMDKLKKISGVITVIDKGKECQVVIGNHVPDVYKDVNELLSSEKSASSEDGVNASGEKKLKKISFKEKMQQKKEAWKHTFSSFRNFKKSSKSRVDRIVSTVSGIFIPILGVLLASGILKALIAILTAAKVFSSEDPNYIILNAISDAVFYFLPLFLGISSAKKFNINPFLGLALGAVLVYPTLIEHFSPFNPAKPLYVIFENTIFESKIYLTFLGIPIISAVYNSSVIPVILAVILASGIQKLLNLFMPSLIKAFMNPLIILLFTIPIVLIVLGPISSWAAMLISQGVLKIYGLQPIIAGMILGFFWQIFVIFGVHWAFVPIMLLNINSPQEGGLGYDFIAPMTFTACFAQTAVVSVIWIKTKDKELQKLCAPAVVSGIFGVTEPAIYGITLPRMKAFIISCFGAALGGGLVGGFGILTYIKGGAMGLPGLIAYVNPNAPNEFLQILWMLLVSIAVAVFSFILAMIFYSEKESSKNYYQMILRKLFKHENIASPVNGQLIRLSNVNDRAFANGELGNGIAFIPKEGKVYAPISGKISMIFPTKHAIGIKSNKGSEVLIHIGLDLINLNGKYFKSHVEQGDKVRKGELLLEFDIDSIKNENYDLTSVMLITNTSSQKEVDILQTENDEVFRKEDVINIVF